MEGTPGAPDRQVVFPGISRLGGEKHSQKLSLNVQQEKYCKVHAKLLFKSNFPYSIFDMNSCDVLQGTRAGNGNKTFFLTT